MFVMLHEETLHVKLILNMLPLLKILSTFNVEILTTFAFHEFTCINLLPPHHNQQMLLRSSSHQLFNPLNHLTSSEATL